MAQQTVLIDLQVSSEQAVKNIEEAREKLVQLDQQKQQLNKTDSDYYDQLARIKESQLAQNNIIRANTDAIKQNVREQQANTGSLVSLRAELKKATTAFDNLTAAERNGATGKELQDRIATLMTEISSAEQATGRFQRNVGNYRGSIVDAFGSMGGAAGKMINPIKSSTEALKMMSKTPVIAILGILVNIIGKVVESLKKNEDAFNKVKASMSAFNTVGVLVQRVVDTLANFIANLAEKLGNLLNKIISAKSALKDQQDISRKSIELLEKERKVQREVAENEVRIARLRKQANETSKYSQSQRLEFLKQAEKMETENFKKQRDLAWEKYQIIKKQNEQTASGTKDLNAQNDAYIAYLNTEKAYNERLSSLTKKQETLTTAIGKTTEAQNENNQATEEAKRLAEEEALRLEEWERRLKEIADANLEAQNKADMAKIMGDMEQYYQLSIQAANHFLDTMVQGADETDAQYQARYIKGLQNLQKAKDDYFNYVNQTQEEQKAKDEKERADELQAMEERKKAYLDFAHAVADAFGEMGKILGEFAEKNKSAAIAQAGLNLAQIYIEQGLAIAKGVKSAMDVQFPGNLAAIASTVAMVMSTIGSTISTVKKAKSSMNKYATGGYIQGEGSGTSDSITARVSNGESVMTAKATSMFYDVLSAMNVAGGGVAFPNTTPGKRRFATGGVIGVDSLSGSFRSSQLSMLSDAIAQMQPVVSVKEITNVQNRIITKERISKS